MNIKILTTLLILCFGGLGAFAQAPEPKTAAPTAPDAPSGLTLEVTFVKGKPPGAITISEAARANWAWYAWFDRVPNFKTSAERLPVQAVKFFPVLENGAVKIRITVFAGEKSFDKEELVANYTMREGERAIVKELANFGVAPLEIAVARVVPVVAALPQVENKTASLQVTGIEPNFSTLPTFKVRILNASEKAVSAFTYEMFSGGRIRGSAMPQNQHGESLIEPGETFTRVLRGADESKQTAGGESQSKQPPTLVISSVIFADGSYEGDAKRAADFRSYNLGRKTEVKRILRLLESFENNFATYDFTKFAEAAAKLETEQGATDFAGLTKEFPALSEKEKTDLREAADETAKDVKKDFVEGMQKHRAEIETANAGTREYLAALKAQYQKWLARL